MAVIGLVKDKRYLDHQTGAGHPEAPRRLELVYQELQSLVTNRNLITIPTTPMLEQDILNVHTPEYLRLLKSTAGQGLHAFSADTHVSEKSYDAALLAAGGVQKVIEAVTDGSVDAGFVLARPPGHHAEKSRAMGYCLLNNVALGAQFALKHLSLNRILLIDWDVHHGNGTQHAFENRSEVAFFSIHQGRLFPGTGFFTEAGYGRGEGYTINVPVPSGYGDAEYAAIFHLLLEPIAQEFEPQLVLVSAGFDAHKLDPIGRMAMTDQGFAALVHSVRKIADTYCNGRYVLTLEGGYHIAALSECIITSIRAMLEEKIKPHDNLIRSANRKKVMFAMNRSTGVHKRYWKTLSGYRWEDKLDRRV